jgi:hypothetical protein
MMVLPHVGHVVHEDKPDSVAEVIATFLTRFKMAESLAAFKRSADNLPSALTQSVTF